MIITTISDDGLYRINKSDSNKYIQKEGTDEIYIEAWDLIEFEYVYIETDIEIEPYRRPMMMAPVVSDGTITPYNTSAFGTTINTNNYYSSVAVLDFNGNVTQIGTNAYKDKTNLYSIAIPDTVTSIGPTAFSGCTNCCVYDFGCSRTTIPTLQDADSFLLMTQYHIVVPDALYSTWSTRTNWSRLSKYVFIKHSDFMVLEKNEPIKFTAAQSSTIGFTYNTEGPAIILYKSTDKVNWERWDFTDITLNTGESIYIKGHNLSGFASTNSVASRFNIIGGVNCTGNTMSLLNEYNKNLITGFAFNRLFNDCTGLITPPELPSLTIPTDSYHDMFKGCTSLVEMPELPGSCNDGDFIGNNAYNSMFNGCTSLVTVKPLMSKDIRSGSYVNMFNRCTSLVTAPYINVETISGGGAMQSMFQNCTSLTTFQDELKPTVLKINCYMSMFNGCRSLTAAPALPATTLPDNCYNLMFYGCSSLTTAPDIPATVIGNGSCLKMFMGCTSLVTGPSVLASQDMTANCYQAMFNGCTNLETTPIILGTILNNGCCNGMFQNCPKVNHITCLATTGFDTTNCLTNWLYGTSTTGTFVKSEGVKTADQGGPWQRSVSGIPAKWIIENNYEEPEVRDVDM